MPKMSKMPKLPKVQESLRSIDYNQIYFVPIDVKIASNSLHSSYSGLT